MSADDAQAAARGLGKRTLRGITWTLVGQVASNALRIAVLAILGRLLAPEEFGQVAAALTVIALALALRHGSGWGRPVDLGDAVNDGGQHAMGSQLGPDHQTLYFYSDRRLSAAGAASWNDGKDNIWRVSLAPWLDSPRADRH